MRDAVTALLGLAGFGMLGCVSPTIAGQALSALIGFGLIGLAYIVWAIWGRVANRVDIDQVTASVNPIEIDRVEQEGD